MQEAEIGGQTLPKSFDVWTEEGLEVGTLATEVGLETSQDSGRSSGNQLRRVCLYIISKVISMYG